MGRFLFPVLPALVLYAFLAAAAGLRALGRAPALAYGLLVALLLSLTLPALAFIHQRAQAPARFAEMVDWYRTPDIGEARARARIHLDLLEDMEAIRKLTRRKTASCGSRRPISRCSPTGARSRRRNRGWRPPRIARRFAIPGPTMFF